MKVSASNSLWKASFPGLYKILKRRNSELNKSVDMFDLFLSAREVLLVMASRSVASALSLLTSESFSFVPSDSPDNDKLEALVREYFTGNDEITDCEESDSDVEGIL